MWHECSTRCDFSIQVLPHIVHGLGYPELTEVVVNIAHFIQLGYRRNLSQEFTEVDLEDLTEALRVSSWYFVFIDSLCEGTLTAASGSMYTCYTHDTIQP